MEQGCASPAWQPDPPSSSRGGGKAAKVQIPAGQGLEQLRIIGIDCGSGEWGGKNLLYVPHKTYSPGKSHRKVGIALEVAAH